MRSNNSEIFFIELKMSYRIALLFNLIIIFIIFGFIFFKDFIYYASFYSQPIFVDEMFSDFWIKKYWASESDLNMHLPTLMKAATDVPANLPGVPDKHILDVLVAEWNEDHSFSPLLVDDDLILWNLLLRLRREQQIELEVWNIYVRFAAQRAEELQALNATKK